MDLDILERINQQIVSGIGDLKKYFQKEEDFSVFRYLQEDLILFLEEHTRDGAIAKLIDLLDGKGKLEDKQIFHDAIMEREKIVSTGIGIGVAIPHAKLQGYEDFFIAVGIQKKQGIDWNALDGSLVRIIFLIGGPDHKQTEYLKILSCLTQAIREEERRKKILQSPGAMDVLQLFTRC